MSEFGSASVVFALLCLSSAVGFFVRSRLPESHRSRDSIELLQLIIGLLVTFAALVLGLITTSVKASFDAADHDRSQYAAQLTQLDVCLRNYGAGAETARDQIHAYTAAVIASTWPSEQRAAGIAIPDASKMARTGANPTLAGLMNSIGLEIRMLAPRDALHEKLAADCFDQFGRVMQGRWAVIEDVGTSISTPFYRIMVAWLMIVFGCFGLRAPPNATVVIVITLCAIAVSSATFVISDMNTPYGGLFGISSDAMREALSDMLQPLSGARSVQ